MLSGAEVLATYDLFCALPASAIDSELLLSLAKVGALFAPLRKNLRLAVLDIFYFSCSGEGKGESRRQEGGVVLVLIESPGGGGALPGERGG